MTGTGHVRSWFRGAGLAAVGLGLLAAPGAHARTRAVAQGGWTLEQTIRGFFSNFGVTFPEGSFVRYDQWVSRLAVRNTLPNLRRIKHFFDEFNSIPPQIGLSLLVLEIDADLAGRWGLDGLPAAEPQSTPLGGDVPPALKPQDAATLVTALRSRPGTRVAASARMLTVSGNTALLKQVVEHWSEQDGEAKDVGVTSECTPTIAPDGTTVDLELRVEISALNDRRAQTAPLASGLLLETRVVLSDGCSLRMPWGPPQTADSVTGAEAKALLAILRADVIRLEPREGAVVKLDAAPREDGR